MWAMNCTYSVYPINAVLQYHRLGNQDRINPEIPFEKVPLLAKESEIDQPHAPKNRAHDAPGVPKAHTPDAPHMDHGTHQ
ncbi:unnamed protein product [Lupinus luteus]|uniref:Uncharacterized protein n=1 Tax=Lupinus luteus TaxID=3873 RepID=A0AAV1XHD4_LUPLU